jgi:YHS domain-containing protein
MFRAILELLFTILIIIVARAVLSSFFRGIARTSSASFRDRAANPQNATEATPPQGPQLGGELHKDPVCGTYVAESTPFRRQSAGQTFYYCSSDCREKHALVAR